MWSDVRYRSSLKERKRLIKGRGRAFMCGGRDRARNESWGVAGKEAVQIRFEARGGDPRGGERQLWLGGLHSRHSIDGSEKGKPR